MARPLIAKAKKHNSAELWARLTVLGIIAYAAIDIVLIFLRPDYSWLHNAESDYGRGSYSWLMDANFLLRCGFSLALVRMVWLSFPKDILIKKSSYWLIVWALASGLLAFFADTPYGYTKLWSSSTHILLAFVAFVCVVVGMILLNRQFRNIGSWRHTAGILSAIAVLAIIALFFIGHSGFKPHRFGGLYERTFLALVLGWEAIVAIKIAHTPMSGT